MPGGKAMNVKDNIRRRRQERLKQLIERDKPILTTMEYERAQPTVGAYGVLYSAANDEQRFGISHNDGQPLNAGLPHSAGLPPSTEAPYNAELPHSADRSRGTEPSQIAGASHAFGSPQTVAAPGSVGALIYPPSGIGTLPPQMMNDPRFRDPEYVWKHRRELYPNLYDTPAYRDEGTSHRPTSPRRRFAFGKLALSALLFTLIWGLFQWDTASPIALKARQYVQSAMTDDFQFNAIAAWYEQHFQGAPSLIPAFGDKRNGDNTRKVTAPAGISFVSPAKGAVVEAFNAQSEGVTVQTAISAPVKAAAAGVVVSVGIKDGQGLTVVVRHSGQYETTYGQLASAQVNKNDWVAEGAMLGQASDNSAKTAGKLYFAVSRNDRYIDPADVVTFD
jgi:stage IV sporulation protein FA